MNGDGLWGPGWPTTPYGPAPLLIWRILTHPHARAPGRARREAALQLRGPRLHALEREIGRVRDEEARAVQPNARVARVQPQLAHERRRRESTRQVREPGGGAALLLDRIPGREDSGGEAPQAFRKGQAHASEVVARFLVGRVDEDERTALGRRQEGAHSLEAVAALDVHAASARVSGTQVRRRE